MYRKILIATDGSELAGKAILHGVALAGSVGATVVFVTVSEPWHPREMFEEAARGNSDPVGRYEDMVETSARNILIAAKAAADDAGVACETRHMRSGEPAQGIVATVEREGCDLVVMASHGRRGLSRLITGSQTSEVLAYSTVPVLVIR